jgi:hypothetical protein
MTCGPFHNTPPPPRLQPIFYGITSTRLSNSFVLLEIKIYDKRSITQYEKLTAVDMTYCGPAWLKIEVASGQIVKVSCPEFYDHKCTYISYLCPTVCSEMEICRRILLKIENMNFYANPFRGESP